MTPLEQEALIGLATQAPYAIVLWLLFTRRFSRLDARISRIERHTCPRTPGAPDEQIDGDTPLDGLPV